MLLRFLVALTACLLVSCRTTAPVASQQLYPRWKITPECETASGPVKIDVSLATSTAQLLTGDGRLLAEMDVSPGIPGHLTPTGTFHVMEKMPLKRSNLYGQYVKEDTREVVVPRTWEHEGPPPEGTVYQGIAMPWWMRLTADGVGMHVGGFERGKPTSHGCIRCVEEGQKLFYERTKVGTPVQVHDGQHPVPSLLDSPATETGRPSR